MFLLSDIEQWSLWLQIGTPLILIGCGWLLGSVLRRSHLKSLQLRESAALPIPLRTDSQLPDCHPPILEVSLASASVVLAVDHFRRLLSWLRRIAGGEVTPHADLLQRARREALQRLREAHTDADLILNLRFQVSSISSTGTSSAVEVFVYGTAVRFASRL